MTLGPGELTLIAVALILVIGPKKLPAFAKKIGRLYRETKKVFHDEELKG